MINPESYIEIYPVGLWHDIKRRTVKYGLGSYLAGQIRRKNWRAVRNYFNGYLAEWHYPPEDMRHTRCGRGWTKRLALRSLGIHIAKSNHGPYRA